MRERLAQAADPRVFVLLTCLGGILVWRAAFPAVLLYLATALLPFGLKTLRGRAEPGALAGIFRFALFWACLKLAMDAASFALSNWPAFADCQAALLTAAGQALLLFLQVFALMTAALALTLALSPSMLARAVSWLIRPFAGKNAWKPALAFALMAHYLPRIQRMIRQAKTAALSRGLPAKGKAFWLLAFPHIFRMLARGTWSQAVAIAGRGLDTAEAWTYKKPLAPAALVALVLGAAWLVFPVFSFA